MGAGGCFALSDSFCKPPPPCHHLLNANYSPENPITQGENQGAQEVLRKTGREGSGVQAKGFKLSCTSESTVEL